MVNDFVLKTMEMNSATLDFKDFYHGILMGLMERHIPIDDVDDEDLNTLRHYR